MSEPIPQQRHLGDLDPYASLEHSSTYENSWAVVIGIDNYAHVNRLDNAVKDALGIADVLIARLDFPRENVFLALDPQPDLGALPYLVAGNIRSANKADIEDLLVNVLPEKAGADDRVLVFYAGHGDQRRVASVDDRADAYLIPADALPGKWNTYVDWEVIRRAGDDFCKAKHIFYILDACYSGIVNTRDAGEPPREVRDSLTNRARQALAAGTNRQVVADAGRDGHSPFTWHLIQGLRGDAAAPERSADGLVISAHDLIGYVRHKVAEENSTEQTPSGGSIPGHGGGDFIFTSPLIGFSGQEHTRLGAGLMELGWRTGEDAAFEAAVRNLREAVRLKRMAREEPAYAEEWFGRALLRTGNDALSLLESAEAQGRITARLHLGLAHAKRGDADGACRALESFGAGLPDHADAAWAIAYAQQLRETGGKRKFALLVGVNQYAYVAAPLQGCVNDVLLVKALLEEVYGFEPAHVKTLTDEQATAANIVAELGRLAAMARPQDTVVFLFSGHGTQMPAGSTDPPLDGLWYVLVPHDYRQGSQGWFNEITEAQLHPLLAEIPARDKLFIASAGHVCPPRDTSAEPNGYRFFAACYRNQYDADTTVDGKAYGAFIYHLNKTVRETAKKGSTANAGRIERTVKRVLKTKGFFQDPAYFGDPAAPLLPWQPRGAQPDFLALHEFGERREYAALDPSTLEAWQSQVEALAEISHPRAWLSCSRAWLAQGQPARAADCAGQALEQRGCDRPEGDLLLCEAHLAEHNAEAALEQVHDAVDVAPLPWSDELIPALEQLARPQGRALLVAIEAYAEGIGVKPKAPARMRKRSSRR